MKRVVYLTVLVIFGLAVFLGSTALAGETAGEYIDDATIHTQTTAIVVKDPDTHYLKIDATVTKGDVVLTGFVNSRETEERLVAKIREIKGVKSIKSFLKVEERK